MLVDNSHSVFTTSVDLYRCVWYYEVYLIDQNQRNEVYVIIGYVRSQAENLDCLVCNAGMSVRKSFAETSYMDWIDRWK